MVRVAARHLDDATVTVLAAEALMDLQPWDYWESGGFTPKGRTAIHDAIDGAFKVLPAGHNNAVLLFTDGEDNSSTLPLEWVSDRTERAIAAALVERTTPRIWLSALPAGRLGGNAEATACV